MSLNAKPVILYDNLFNYGTPTATDTAAGYDVLSIRDWRTYTFHKFAAFGTKYIYIDCGAAKSADALFLMGGNLFTASATVSLESSTTGAWAGEQVERIAGFTPPDDKAVLKVFASVSARYWRIKFVTGAIAVQTAIAVIGPRFAFERWPLGSFDPDDETIMGESSNSKTGNLLGAVTYYFKKKISMQFQNLTPVWCKSSFKPVWDAHLKRLKPFVFAWDITNHADEVYLVKVPDKFNKKMPYNPVRRDMTLDMEGVSEDI